MWDPDPEHLSLEPDFGPDDVVVAEDGPSPVEYAGLGQGSGRRLDPAVDRMLAELFRPGEGPR